MLALSAIGFRRGEFGGLLLRCAADWAGGGPMLFRRYTVASIALSSRLFCKRALSIVSNQFQMAGRETAR